MNCYNHNDIPGVAICTSCGKALCKTCVQITGDILACSPECTAKLQNRDEVYSLSSKRSKLSLATTAFVYFAAGGLFLIFGIYYLFYFIPLGILLTGAGVVFVIAGVRYRKTMLNGKQEISNPVAR
ncbi:MAG TPA: hypothetical protein VHR47_02150 [Bacillota bacterium]|nr:hypothetical protein [Bacillota bacterium]